MKLPFEYENIPVHIDFHVGCVNLRDGDTDAYSLQRKADIALNHAIEQKIDYFIYKQEEDRTNKKNIGLLGSLNNAIETGQLLLHFQPKVDIHTRKMLGVEALLRWQHPEDGMIPPGNFIPQAEQTNLINPITEWVLGKALDRMSVWKERGFHPIMAVNISARNLHDPAFEESVYRLLEQYNVPPNRLELEVTETALMNNPRHAIKILTELANSKITISIDDFGTGYSSLGYLCELPATIIKIDQYFVRNISQGKAIKNIIESATKLAHSLDMEVVAEGVEDEEGLKFLADIGCDIAQGFFISRPIPERKLLAFAATN
jgi:EAL domain-containing protein (putative c-di-GMP-specific phosphodiesterase class I)